MFNLNNIPIPENDSSAILSSEQTEFPTDGFKNILQNSDLLELLMKPIQNPEIEKEKLYTANTESTSFDTDLSSLNFDDLLKSANKSHFDHDYFEDWDMSKLEDDGKKKSYGNAFLGPNLWEKDDMFQGEKFGVEYLGIDEFLNENNLNEADIKFLDGLQSNEPSTEEISKQVTDTNTSSLDSFTSPVNNDKLAIPPVFTQKNVVVKLKDDSPINKVPLVKKINSFMDDAEQDLSEDLSADYADTPSKKFFDQRLTLQPTLKKSKKQFVPNELKDEKYWARRNKNNVAAKRSRDTRRFKENQIVIAATYLEHENDQLRKKLEEYKTKMAEMQEKLNKYESGISN